jgi:hypothetical protein
MRLPERNSPHPVLDIVAQAPKTSIHRQPGFDFLPLTAPPKIEPVGRISGEGV